MRGIDAECGGSCSCTTCHVYVDPDFHGGIAPPDGDEEALLDATAAPDHQPAELPDRRRPRARRPRAAGAANAGRNPFRSQFHPPDLSAPILNLELQP
ncbi:MAG: hypothetical protein MO853_14190 [Candidatus Protistobacter heckmanni]|nr:hypothetical protein [Candidatus Protistobacter heckmanni]